MKVSRLLLIIALVLVSVAMLYACDGFDSNPAGKVYTIIFDVNNGDGEDIPVLTNGRQPIVMPANPVRNGYDFLGWFFDVEGKVKLTPNYFVTNPISSNQRVYAIWRTAQINDGQNPGGEDPIPGEEPAFTVTFHSADVNPKSITVNSPLKTAITVSYPEHNFIGWYTNPDFLGAPVILPLDLTEDISLYAKWEIKKYSITFAPGDGASGNSPIMADKALGEQFILPQSSYIRPNHVFIGWHDGYNLLSPGNEYTVVNKTPVTFTARWDRIYTATFYGGDGGIGASFSLPAIRGGVLFTMPNSQFTKPNFVFLAWREEGTNATFAAGETNSMPYKDQRYDAVWIDAYTIIFDGGDDALGDPPVIAPQPAGAKIVLPDSSFVREGYEFICWKDASGNEYEAKTLFTIPARSITLSAVWQETITYPVSFLSGQGATGEAPPIVGRRPGTVMMLPANPFEKTYYRFDGWEHGGVVYSAGSAFTVPSGAVSFEAKWSPINYSIRYHIQEGYVSSNPSIYNTETPTFTLTNPQVEGYAFEGWYSDQGFQYPVETITIVTGSAGDLEFYAKLAPLTFKIYFSNLQGAALNGAEPGGYIEVKYGLDYSEAFSRVGAVRSGYLLAYWAYQGKNYIPSAVWNRAEDLTLSAVWTEVGTSGLIYAINADNTSYSVTRYNGQEINVTVPSYYNKLPVTAIGIAAFNQSAIISVSLPETLLTIGDEAFKASRLAKITLPASLTSIGSYAFADTNYLETVSIKDGSSLYSIGANAFYNSSALGYIRLPEALVKVGKSAFGGSPSLSIYSSAIGAAGGFEAGWNSQGAPVYWGLIKDGDFYFAADSSGLSLVEYAGKSAIPQIPEEVNSVPVVSVGSYAFRSNALLEGMILPSQVAFIAPGAFINTVSLQYVYIPNSVASLDSGAFAGAESVVLYAEGEVSYQGNAPLHNNVMSIMFENNWHFISSSEGAVKITKFAGDLSAATVPEILGGNIVTAVGDGAFRNAKTLSVVFIPASIAEMGKNVFEGTTLQINALTEKPMPWVLGWNSGRPVTWGYTVITSEPEYNYVQFEDKAYIVSYKNNERHIEIPSMLNGLQVAGVYGSFVNNSLIRTVLIPDTVDEIANIFINCPALVIYTASAAPKAGWINWNTDGLPVHYSSYPHAAIGGYTVTLEGGKALITGYDAPITDDIVLPFEVNIDGAPYEVVGVGANAFYGAGFARAFIPSGYHIESNAFIGNNQVVIYYEGSEADALAFGSNWHGGAPVYFGYEIPLSEDGFDYVLKQNYAVITGYSGGGADVYIPHKIGGYNVFEIGERAFLSSAVSNAYLPYGVFFAALDAFKPSVTVERFAPVSGEYENYSYVAYGSDVYLTGYSGSEKVAVVPPAVDGVGNVIGLVNAFDGASVSSVIVGAGVKLVSQVFINMVCPPTLFLQGDGSDIVLNDFIASGLFYSSSEVLEDAGYKYILSGGMAVIIDYYGGAADIIVPDSLGGAAVYAIIGGVFAGYENLITVRIPLGIILIREGAFTDSPAVKVYLQRELNLGEEEWYQNITLVAGKEIFVQNGIEYYIENGQAIIIGYIGVAENLTIPAVLSGYEVTKLNDKAFFGFSSIAEITVPATILYMGTDVFTQCGDMIIRLEALIPNPDWASDWNSGLEVIYGVGAYKQSENFRFIVYDGKAYLVEYTGSQSEVVIGANIEDGEGASYPVADIGRVFAGNKAITSLIILGDIKDIFPAIQGATSLENIHIPSSVTEIPDEAFAGFKRLKTVTFGLDSELIRIGYRAFYDCALLDEIEIPYLVNYIGDEAFMNCSSLTEIVLPWEIKAVGRGLFENCWSLAKAYAAEINYIGENAFKDARSLSSFSAWGIREVGASAFENAKALAYIDFDDQLEYIGARAFAGVTSLRYVNIASASYIGNEAFKGATSVKVVDGIINAAYIGESAFENALSLSLTAGFGGSVQYIGAKAFYNVGYFGELNISNTLTFIGLEAFAGAGLENITVDAGNPIYKSVDGVLYNKSASALLQYPALSQELEFRVPASVTSIAPSAFRGAAALSSVTLHGGVRSAGAKAFENCVSLTIYSALPAAPSGFDVNYNSSLRPVYWSTSAYSGLYSDMIYIQEDGKITITGFNGTADGAYIPSSINDIPVTDIGRYAFSYSNIKWVYIPKSVISIGEYAFVGSAAAAIYCEADSAPEGYSAGWNLSYDSKGNSITLPVYFGTGINVENGFQFVEKEGFAVITKYVGVGVYAAVPATLGGLEAAEIGKFAFVDTRLKSVFIPDNISKISSSAFRGNGYVVIYTNAASVKPGWETGFSNLRPVYYGVSEVRTENGFEYITREGNVTITRYSGSEANAIIPAVLGGNPVTEIGYYAFAGSLTLEYIKVPASVKAIGNYAFADCVLLNDFEFEAGSEITVIGSYAFQNNVSLSRFYIPASVIVIKYSIFNGCNGLEVLFYGGGLDIPDGWEPGWNYLYGEYVYIVINRK